MTEAKSRRKAHRTDSRQGITRLKATVRELDPRVRGRRRTLGQALAQWRSDLLQDLGGVDAVSTQEMAVVELAVKTKLLLDSVDAWLLVHPSVVNVHKRALLPVVRERTQLADALARYMGQLGLKRRARPGPSLEEYIAARYGEDSDSQARPDEAGNPAPRPSPASREADEGGGDVSEEVPSGETSSQENRGASGEAKP